MTAGSLLVAPGWGVGGGTFGFEMKWAVAEEVTLMLCTIVYTPVQDPTDGQRT